MKIGFSGVGNMSSAIIEGIISGQNHNEQSVDLHAYSPSGPKTDRAFHKHIQWHESNLAMAEAVDVFILGVKPHIIADVMREIASVEYLPLVISLAAGTPIDVMTSALDHSSAAVIRSMPNTPSAVQAGMTGLFANESVTAEQKQQASFIFQQVGQVLWLDKEEAFHILTALSGSGPAYFFQFTQAMIEAGVAGGLSRDQASLLATQTAYGAGLYMKTSDLTPATLQKNVTSPNGTTFAATETFRQQGLETLVTEAVDAAAKRSKSLAEG